MFLLRLNMRLDIPPLRSLGFSNQVYKHFVLNGTRAKPMSIFQSDRTLMQFASGTAGQQGDRVFEDRSDHCKTFPHGLGRAGKIDN